MKIIVPYFQPFEESEDEEKPIKRPQQPISFGAQVTVKSAEQKDLEKKNRKELKKSAKVSFHENTTLRAAKLLGLEGQLGWISNFDILQQ